MKIKAPRFSIVIPCYNEEKLLGSTLASLGEQVTSASYEVIVVDNNCTDTTAQIALSYGAQLVHQPVCGVSAARQKGTEKANGEIVISTDADTRFAPDWLDKIDQTFQKDAKLVAVGGPCRYYDGPWWGKIYTYFLFGWSTACSFFIGRPLYVTATNLAFKKSAWDGYNLVADQGADELGLLHQLRRRGRIGFRYDNPTYTSARRLERGLLYNIFVSFLYYYLTGYYVNSMFNRHIIHQAPAFRDEPVRTHQYRWATSAVAVVAFIILVSLFTAPPVKSFVADNKADAVRMLKRNF